MPATPIARRPATVYLENCSWSVGPSDERARQLLPAFTVRQREKIAREPKCEVAEAQEEIGDENLGDSRRARSILSSKGEKLMHYALSIRGGGIRGIIPCCCLVKLEVYL